MIVRLVCMKVKPEKFAEFRAIYEGVCDRIRAFPGCTFLQLLLDSDEECNLYTISYWQSPEDLEAYRHSSFFRGIWERLKPLFRDKPWAQSTTVLIDSSDSKRATHSVARDDRLGERLPLA
ncbi:MAG TPA: antibiotic biosynthesis monooxygenase family protein [Anaerolineae bacterium]|nr:antibiotic biosynthesis monooxygenase family protein [Anaerolineae bacterium]